MKKQPFTTKIDTMIGRKVFLQDQNCFATEVDITLTVSDGDYDSFLKIWDIDTLQRLLKTSVEQENYEMAALIKKHIELKQTK